MKNDIRKSEGCVAVEGSMRRSWDPILVSFSLREYRADGEIMKVLSVEKLGHW